MEEEGQSLRPEEHVFRYVFASPSAFVGGCSGKDYDLSILLQDWGHPFSVDRQPGYIILSLRIVVPREPMGDRQAVPIPTFEYIGSEFSALLGAFTGKLIVNLGPLQSIGRFVMPKQLPEFPRILCYPLSSTIRKPGNVDLNLGSAKGLLERFIGDYKRERTGYILRAAEFYRAAIEALAGRPEIAVTMLCSTLETLLPLREFTDDELYDESLSKTLRTIEAKCGDSIARQIKGRLFQIKRRVAAFVNHYLPEGFVEVGTEKRAFARFKDRADVVNRIRATYDLRSQLLHTGNREGLWFLTSNDPTDDIALGSPVCMSDGASSIGS